jgi:hypothetical protein
MISLNSLNHDSFINQIATVDKFLTVSKRKSYQSNYPKVCIFDLVLINSLNLNSFKNQVLTVEKILIVSEPSLDSLEILNSQ